MAHRRELAQRIYRALYGIGAPVDIVVEEIERFESLKQEQDLVYSDIASKGTVIYEKK